tara:strand:- start:426 stop:1430 length:1005 start_codon:yes stop_codon:yes gene_type:complete
MAFLRLNGVTVPITVDNASRNILERTSRTRTINGGYIVDTVYSKRTYNFTTTPLTEMEALAFEGLINGDGDILTFDDITATSKGSDASGSVTIAYSSTVPTGFTGKSGTVSNGGENYDLGIGSVKANQDLTINLWTNPSATDPGSLQYIFNFSDGAATYKNSARAYRTTDGKLNFKVSASDASSGTNNTSHLQIADPFDGNFKMLTFVVRRNAESGEYNQYMYVNAVLQAFATTAHTPTPSAWNEWVIASGGSNGEDWNNKMDDFQILPYAATSSLITGWYNFGQNVGQHPILKMDGDLTRDTIVNVRGNVVERKLTHLGGRVKQTLTFDLTET